MTFDEHHKFGAPRRQPIDDGVASARTLSRRRAVVASGDRRRPVAGGVSQGPRGGGIGGLLMMWDVLATIVVFGIASGGDTAGGGGWRVLLAASAAAALIPLSAARLVGYEPRAHVFGGSVVLLGRMLLLALACSGLAWMVAGALGVTFDPGRIAASTLLLAVLWLAGRIVADRKRRTRPERTLIVGTGPTARAVLELTRRHPEHNLTVVGFIDDEPLDLGPGDPPVIGGLAGLWQASAELAIDRVIVAFGHAPDAEVLDHVRRCDGLGVQIDVVPRLFDLVGNAPSVSAIGGLPLVRIKPIGARRAERATKRAFDLVVAGVLLVPAAPVMLAIAVAIAVSDGRPVLFRQPRVGRGGAHFRIVKFRTMRNRPDGHDEAGALEPLRDDPVAAYLLDNLKRNSLDRVTPLGGWLRRTSLDELPQLWNVLRGEMSLVGPRPLSPYENRGLEPWQRRRQDARPGITGLWQVLGRSDVLWSERMQLDYTYVRHWSLAADMRILARTVRAVVRRHGAL